MTAHVEPPITAFARWEAEDALDALYRAGLDVDHVEQARWPDHAPQPRTHRQAYTFRGGGCVDPHLLLVFDTPEALDAWRLWLARYWKARPYLSVYDNLLLLVSRDLPASEAQRYHAALRRIATSAAEQPTPPAQTAAEPPAVRQQPSSPPGTTPSR